MTKMILKILQEMQFRAKLLNMNTTSNMFRNRLPLKVEEEDHKLDTQILKETPKIEPSSAGFLGFEHSCKIGLTFSTIERTENSGICFSIQRNETLRNLLSDIFNTSTGLLLLPSDGMTNKAGKSQN
jgi:hypothetical protein